MKESSKKPQIGIDSVRPTTFPQCWDEVTHEKDRRSKARKYEGKDPGARPRHILSESGKIESIWKVPRWVLFKAKSTDLGDYSRWPAEFISCAFIWGVVAQFGSAARHATTIFRNVLSTEPSSTRTDAPSR